ncbi:MAG: hypothetical protein HYW71_01700 [Candidatus Niyogibacteria bacterium]|nr:hypothetical protein [Candidatus Niyogibacteria bacterium]
MAVNILDKLFGSSLRLKIIRIFMLHPEEIFNNKEVAKRVRSSAAAARREITLLKNIDFIVLEKQKKKARGMKLNPLFPFYNALKGLVLNSFSVSRDEITKRIKRLGRIKLIIISGIFLQEKKSRLDLLVVGDGVKKTAMEKVLKWLEAEMGKELDYAFLNEKEFLYRLEMYDKFVRDILDHPHEKLLNKLDI